MCSAERTLVSFLFLNTRTETDGVCAAYGCCCCCCQVIAKGLFFGALEDDV